MTNKTKNPLQISWEDIKITAMPPKKMCGKPATTAPKEIIKGVSGTVMPG